MQSSSAAPVIFQLPNGELVTTEKAPRFTKLNSLMQQVPANREIEVGSNDIGVRGNLAGEKLEPENSNNGANEILEIAQPAAVQG